MSMFRVGTLSQSGIHLANIDPAMEAEAAQFDMNRDGVLTLEEAQRFFKKMVGDRKPVDLDEVLKLLGGVEHVVKCYSQDAYTVRWEASDWKGDFHIPGVGAGNVCTGRQHRTILVDGVSRPVEAYHVLVDCNLISQEFLEQKVRAATLEIGPIGLPRREGSERSEIVSIPLDVATSDPVDSYQRGGGKTHTPDRKSLSASIDLADLRLLMGEAEGLEFYGRIETTWGGTLYINRDGLPFRNFLIPADELRIDTP